jgi:hypothetical protein
MIKQFFVFYDHYIEVCTENVSKDGRDMVVCKKRKIKLRKIEIYFQ